MDLCSSCFMDMELGTFYREQEERYWAEQEEAYHESLREQSNAT